MWAQTEQQCRKVRGRGNMANGWLGPSSLGKTPHFLQIPFPLAYRPPSMAAFSSSNLNHCRSSSNPNPLPSQPSLLVFSGLFLLSLFNFMPIACLNSALTSQVWIAVVPGGTAFNGIVEELKNFTTRVAHVLPVSDDGGSTAEIVRVLGISILLLSFYVNYLIPSSSSQKLPLNGWICLRWSCCWRYTVQMFETV